MMKKTILAALVSVMAFAGSAASKNATQADTLSASLGALQGNYLGTRVAEDKSGAELKKYRKEFLRGLREAMLADTANTGYSDGLSVGGQMLAQMRRMHEAGVSTDIDLYLKTFARYYNGEPMTAAEADSLEREISEMMKPVQRYYEQQKARAQEDRVREMQQRIDANKAAGQKYMASLKNDGSGYQTTPSGLLYKVVSQGEGPLVKASDRVKVYYTGRLVDGTVFDSTEPGKPATFHASQLIKGFTEGLLMMNKGAKYTLVIPYELAYGEQGPPVIGPAQTLIFDVEVLEILPE